MAKIWGKMKIIIPLPRQLTNIVKNIIQCLDFISEFTRYLEIPMTILNGLNLNLRQIASKKE